MYYCEKHSLGHASYNCPRCEIEERHQELVDLHESSIQAVRESDYNHKNPGEYECPNCGYITLKYRKSRCCECQGEVKGEYWERVDAAKEAAAERRRAKNKAEAEERERTAPARAAAAKAARAAAKAAAFSDDVKGGFAFAMIIGAVVGFPIGAIIGATVDSIGGYNFQQFSTTDCGFTGFLGTFLFIFIGKIIFR